MEVRDDFPDFQNDSRFAPELFAPPAASPDARFAPSAPVAPVAPAAEPVADATTPTSTAATSSTVRPDPPGQWTAPGKFRSTLVPTGPYAGVSIVGEPGSLLETVREMAPPIVGGHRPAVVVDVVDAGPVTIGAVSLRGALHYDSRVVRQDTYAIGMSDDGKWVIVALADGIGSAPLSHLGADTAAQQSVTSVRAELGRAGFDNANWQLVADEVRTKVRETSRQRIGGKLQTADGSQVDADTLTDEELARNMGTTSEFLVVALEPVESGRFPYVRVVIAGDGTGLVLDPSRGWKTLSVGKSHVGGFANNAVLPLPIDSGPPLVQPGQLEPGQAVLATSDGIGDFIGNGSTEVGGYLHQEWSKPVSVVNLVRSASFITYQSDDDRTAVIVWV